MLTIIIPVYNEINTLEKILKKILIVKKIKKKIIIVDDGSTDGTRELLKKKISKDKNIFKIIYHKNNMGKGAAINSAKKYIGKKFVIIQDADLEYNPKDYNKILEILQKRKHKAVYGSRVLGKNRYLDDKKTKTYRIFANHVLTIFSNIINNQRLTDAHTCYKAFDAKLFKKITLREKGFSFCPEITTKISNLKIDIKEVKINYMPRSYDQGKKISFIDGFDALWTIIKYKYFKK